MNSIAVCAGKGGPGATFTAVNLAYAFQNSGRDILLLDLDPNGGDIAGYLGLDPRKGLYPLSLMGRADYATEKLLREIEERAGIACIAGFPTATPAEAAVLIQIIESARQSGRLVIADVGRVDARSAEVAGSADLVLVVARPDLISTHATQRAKDSLLAEGLQESQLRLVVSGSSLRRAADAIELGEAVGMHPIGMIPSARGAARKALQTQLPLSKGRVAKAFADVAARLSDVANDATALKEAAVA